MHCMNRITHQLGDECYISCYHGFLSALLSILAGGGISSVVAVVKQVLSVIVGTNLELCR